MKKQLTIIVASIALAASMHIVHAGSTLSIKLPYKKGQSFVVTQGYNTAPTHIKKDSYALDLTQNGCDAYGAPVVAAASGTVMFLSQEGYNGGYGAELILDHGNNIVSRYAHMIPDSIKVGAKGMAVGQGQAIGLLGDTGLVAGAACAEHPGAHLHFAMDTVNGDGTFSAYDPEPISGYEGVTAGKWYLSDNGTTTLATPTAITTPTTTTAIATSGIVMNTITPPVSIIFSGSVPVPPAENISTSTDESGDISTTTTSTPTSTAPVLPQSGTLFEQSDDTARSPGSFYDDNWFQLGNGFSGTLNTLTLEGMVNASDYFASHVALEEYKDIDYTGLIQQFPISDNAPFTNTMATATFDGLSILLKPYLYYRLTTIQDYQNRSVILAGTTSTSVGVVMAHNFIYDTGGVETTSTFFPFMKMEGIVATSTLTPPPLTTPANITETFDPLNMQVTLAWSTSTDPDWPDNPLRYAMNYSTSTSLSDDGWMAPAPFPVTIGNTYLVGIRAADDYGDVSAAVTTTWNFPSGFVPYLLSPELGSGSQSFTVAVTSTLSSITVFTTNFKTGAANPWATWCSLELMDEDGTSWPGPILADNGNSGYDCQGAPTFSFASSLPTLYAGHQYQWLFDAGGAVQFYGNEMNTAGGGFGDPSLLNAKFTLTGTTGILFDN